KGMLGYIITTGFVMAAGTLGIFTYKLRVDPQAAQTLAFSTFVFFQLFNMLNCRSNNRSIFKIGFLSNRTSILSITSVILILAAIVSLPQVQGVFGTVPLPSWDWLLSIATASIIFFTFEFFKAVRRNNQSFPPK
ncbi:MAG TPA: cation-translocating P-type ATPase C-terminal domain-containing protein, partial [Candidatus Methanoperedens sp.]